MKKYFLIAFFALFSTINIHAGDQEGLFSLGGNINYGSEKDLIGFGVRAQRGFTDDMRWSAEYKYFIDRRDWSQWQINADLHYMFEVSQTVSIYPLAGLHFARWTLDTGRGSNVSEEARYKKSQNRLGINLGFGGQIQLANHVYLQIEPRYEISNKYSQFVGSFGLMFQF